MVKSKKKGKAKKAKPKMTKKEKLLHTRVRWVKQQLEDAEMEFGRRNVLYFNCPVSDTKRFPKVRYRLETARATVARWTTELFRLEQLIKHGKYKELD